MHFHNWSPVSVSTYIKKKGDFVLVQMNKMSERKDINCKLREIAYQAGKSYKSYYNFKFIILQWKGTSGNSQDIHISSHEWMSQLLLHHRLCNSERNFKKNPGDTSQTLQESGGSMLKVKVHGCITIKRLNKYDLFECMTS